MHPVFFHFGHIVLPSFGVLAAAGVFAALRLSERTAGLLGVDGDAMWNAGLFTVVAAFVASRVLLLFTDLRGFAGAPLMLLAVPSLTVGGVGLTVLLVLGYLQWKRIPVLRAMDAWAAPGMVLWAALAIGHLLEGSDPGMPTRGWGVRGMSGGREQPVALYAALLALGLAGVLLDRALVRRRAGRLAAWGLIGAGVAQFGLSFVRQPYVWAMLETRWWMVLDPIEWAGLGLVLAGVFVWLASETEAPAGGKRGRELARER